MPSTNKKNIMEEIEKAINDLAGLLNGHNALIQVQIGGTYFIRKIGNINKLAERPQMRIVTSDSSFPKWMERQIRVMPVRSGTLSNHRNTLQHLIQFRGDFKFSEINYTFIVEFEAHLKALRLSTNTIAKIIKIFRRYANLAMDEDIFVTNAFRKYQIKLEKKEHPALTEREVKKIENAPVKNDEELRAKQTFLLAIYTGLRYSDVNHTRHSDMRTVNKKKWLVLKQRKTDNVVKIPISSIFYGKAGPLIGVIAPSNSRCNIILKRLCKRSHIRKHVTMHTARRTCASILTARGVELNIVKNILGHESVKTTEGYVSTQMTTISRSMRRAFK